MAVQGHWDEAVEEADEINKKYIEYYKKYLDQLKRENLQILPLSWICTIADELDWAQCVRAAEIEFNHYNAFLNKKWENDTLYILRCFFAGPEPAIRLEIIKDCLLDQNIDAEVEVESDKIYRLLIYQR